MARNRSVLRGLVVPLLADLMCQRTLLRQWVCFSPSSAFTSGASPKETACSKNKTLYDDKNGKIRLKQIEKSY